MAKSEAHGLDMWGGATLSSSFPFHLVNLFLSLLCYVPGLGGIPKQFGTYADRRIKRESGQYSGARKEDRALLLSSSFERLELKRSPFFSLFD